MSTAWEYMALNGRTLVKIVTTMISTPATSDRGAEPHRVFARTAAAPMRDIIFTANTGHELGHTGLDLFLHENPDLIQDAHIWMHLGANFAAKVGSQVRLQYSDDRAVNSLAPWLEKNGLKPADVTPIGERPLGEARNIYDGQGRYVSILGGNGLFHHPADQWPEAVDLELTTRWIKTFVQLSMRLTGKMRAT